MLSSGVPRDELGVQVVDALKAGLAELAEGSSEAEKQKTLERACQAIDELKWSFRRVSSRLAQEAAWSPCGREFLLIEGKAPSGKDKARVYAEQPRRFSSCVNRK